MKRDLTRAMVIRALHRMGELAEEDGVQLEINIYGGTAMMLAYNLRQITKDVDAIFHPKEIALKYIRKVASELGLPEDWMNDDVSMYLGMKQSTRILNEYSSERGLRIQIPTAGYLLAMKALACRDALPGYRGDLADLEYLIEKMNIKNLDDIQRQIDQYYTDDAIPKDKGKILDAIIQKVRAKKGSK